MEIINQINLNSIKKVKEFVADIIDYKSDIYLHSGRYYVNAKSILSILSLDISKDLYITIDGNDYNEISEINNTIKKYLV